MEKEFKLTFLFIYKKFYLECQKSGIKILFGTDLYHNKNELQKWALELLEDDNTTNFLIENVVLL